MADQPLHALVRHLHTLAGGPQEPEPSDQELLSRFIYHRDEAAFAALVRRHGPMVREVCWRLLGQAADADDAFQASFLVLLRQARSIRKRSSLASWLYGVAYRVALGAKRDTARRRRRERRAAGQPPADPAQEVAWREVCAVLDAELYGLAEAYRAPLVLCYLEGRTRDEAARQLGWSLRTLDRRLEQGRARLRARLAGRGLTLSAALLVTGLARPAPAAAVPVALAVATVRTAARQLASGLGLAETVGGRVAALAECALHEGAVAKIKVVAALALLTGLAAGAGLLASLAPQPGQAPAIRTATTGPATRAASPPASKGSPLAPTDCYGDPLPPGALARMGTVRLRQGCSMLSFFPDSKTLAVRDGFAFHLWDTVTGKEVHAFEGLHFPIQAGHFAPDGKTYVATDSREAGIRIYDPVAGKERPAFPKPKRRGQYNGFAFSPDSRRLVSGNLDGQVQIWDVRTASEVLRLHAGAEVWCVAFAPDGRTVAADSGNLVLLWDSKTGQVLRRLHHDQDYIPAIQFSPDGKLLACAVGGIVHLWQPATGKEVRRFGLPGRDIYRLAFAPDGTTLATGHHLYGDCTESMLRLWDTATGKEVRPFLPPCTGWVVGLAFSPDGKILASADEHNMIRVWDPATGRERLPLAGVQGPVNSLAYAPDGRTLASAMQNGVVCLWDSASGKEVARWPGSPGNWYVATNGQVARVFARRLAYSPDGKILASAAEPNAVRLSAVPSGREIARLQVKGRPVEIRSLAFAAGGTRLVLGSAEGVCVCPLPGGQRCAWKPFQPADAAGALLTSLALAPDGRTLAAAYADGWVRVRETATGKEIRRFRAHPIGTPALAFDPAGKMLAVLAYDGSVGLWDVRGQSRIRQLRGPQQNPRPEGPLSFSPDGKTLAAGCHNAILLWEVATGGEQCRFDGQQDLVRSLAFGPDSRTLASGGDNTTTLVWDVTGSAGTRTPRGRAFTVQELEALWADLAGEDAARAFRAIWSLAGVPSQASAFLRPRLRPVTPTDTRRLANLVADLDSNRFAVRQRAAKELNERGESVEGPLRQLLAGPLSPEARRRLEELVAKLERDAVSGGRLRALRAVEVLEHIGTPDAQEALQALANGARGARLTQEAQAALGRLTQRHAARP